MCSYIVRAASSHLSSSSFPHFGFRPLLLVGFTCAAAAQLGGVCTAGTDPASSVLGGRRRRDLQHRRRTRGEISVPCYSLRGADKICLAGLGRALVSQVARRKRRIKVVPDVTDKLVQSMENQRDQSTTRARIPIEYINGTDNTHTHWCVYKIHSQHVVMF
jgi:hypothetical protein